MQGAGSAAVTVTAIAADTAVAAIATVTVTAVTVTADTADTITIVATAVADLCRAVCRSSECGAFIQIAHNTGAVLRVCVCVCHDDGRVRT